MALFRFRTRNPARDHQTDENRLERLLRSVEGIRAEMERERDGLRARYENIMADAAFSQQALEDERVDADISVKIDDMTETMIRYYKRIAWLESQIAFVTDIDREIALFFQENEEGRASLKAAAGHAV
jgi:succinylglutamate desuccinylase